MLSRTALLLLLVTFLSLSTATLSSGVLHKNAHHVMKRSLRQEHLHARGNNESSSTEHSSASGSQSRSSSGPSSTSGGNSTSSRSSDWWWPFPFPFPHFNHHSGDGTYYEPGLGSCGKTNSASDMIVAISHSLYDSKATDNPNSNPFCGKRIKATYHGKSVVVTVVDRCTGCQHDDLDFSPAAFKKFAPMSEGRLKNVQWSFTNDWF
ncbi:hypothetical protein MNAN1_001821 [Malassezia nana]|uniref:RlpA-like protein double-psi beta-barrel domain-containing protein n=1 Tax=Malassezia nana TaxID=180528 RepID=A0AAF0EHX0_9BASI|nr:hypothetical protein MNAN1_001821 [Malassezia nana]